MTYGEVISIAWPRLGSGGQTCKKFLICFSLFVLAGLGFIYRGAQPGKFSAVGSKGLT